MRYTLLVLCLASCAAVAETDSWTDSLLPRPREVVAADGTYTLNPARLQVWITAPDEAESARLAARCAEAFERLGLKPEITTRAGEPFAIVIGERNTEAPKLDPLPEYGDPEGYVLRVSADGIGTAAPTEVGVFYGLMTAEQALRHALTTKTPLARATVADWPAIGMRGYHEDYGRDQLPTIEDHKRSIRLLAQYKMNSYFWFIEPDHFVYDFDPEISTEYDRFRFDDIRKLVAYAKDYYITVVPVVELLGHMEMTLRHERYQHLAERDGGGNLAPVLPEARELTGKMVDEIAAAFDGPYFHCGLDESWDIGQGKSADAVQEHGIEKVYADYYTYLHDRLAKHGKQMIIYADIALNHPGILDLLPKDMVMMFWDYAPREHYDGLDTLAGKGFPVMALSGMWDWSNLYPVYPPGFANMQVLAAQAAETEALGHFVSDWGDGYRGVAGINLSEWAVYGALYCGAVSWNTGTLPMEEFSKTFAVQYAGVSAPVFAEALTRLARCQGDDLSHNTQARNVFFGDPFEVACAMIAAPPEQKAFWERLKGETDAVHAILSKANPPQNADVVQAWDLAARMLNCAADIALLGARLAHGFDKPGHDAVRIGEDYDNLAVQHRALWDEYRAVWLRTNRPLNAVHIGRLWQSASDALQTMAGRVRDGKFPPSAEKKDLAFWNFNSEAPWKDSLNGIALSTVADVPVPESVDGVEGQALRFSENARAEGLDDARLLDLGPAPFLVEVWARHNGQREQTYASTFVSYGVGGGGWRFGLDHNGAVRFTLYGINEYIATKSIVPPDGEWHAVAVNFHDCRQTEVYIDGVHTETLPTPGYARSPQTPLIRLGNEIGLVTPYDGDLDHVRISSGHYTPEEVIARQKNR